jgi:hypothetical protein
MRLAAALALFFALSSVAQAAAPVDLSRARCEDPRVIKLIKDTLLKMTYGGGKPLSPYLGDNSHLTATTISATRQQLICHVGVNFDLRSQQLVRGRFTIHAFASGKMTGNFEAGY